MRDLVDLLLEQVCWRPGWNICPTLTYPLTQPLTTGYCTSMRFDSVRMSVGSIFTNILTVRTTASAGIAFSLEAGQPRDSPEPSFNIESHYYLI